MCIILLHHFLAVRKHVHSTHMEQYHANGSLSRCNSTKINIKSCPTNTTWALSVLRLHATLHAVSQHKVMHGAIHRYLLVRKTCGYKTKQDMIYHIMIIMFCTLFATEEGPFGLLHVLPRVLRTDKYLYKRGNESLLFHGVIL